MVPTLSELMGEYRVAGVQTMRSAQAVLVDEGVLETRQGSGAYIVRVPSSGNVTLVAIGHELEHLERGLAALKQEVRNLDTVTFSRAVVPPKRGRAWAWASWTHCTTCACGDRGTTRGWVNDDDQWVDPDGDPCVREGHEVSSGIGTLPESDPETAAAVESWWEYHAQNEEAAALLLAGDHATATWHAQRGRDLADQYDDFVGFASPVIPESNALNS